MECDSPGSIVKYCSYVMMDIDNNRILHMVTVDKCQVGLQSPNMEIWALEQCTADLLKEKINVTVVMDASTTIAKLLCKWIKSPWLLLFTVTIEILFLLGSKHPNVFHSLDVWHKSKKLKKVFAEVLAKLCCKMCITAMIWYLYRLENWENEYVASMVQPYC